MSVYPLDKSLIALLADGNFHSGAALARGLGISRAAVWKHVHHLSELGLELVSLPGRGYRLLSPVELLSEDLIRENLNSRADGLLHRLEIHDVLDSTNSHLLRIAATGAANGTVCLAEYQQHGRGRIGRDWVSPFGANLYLSALWRFEDPAQVSGLSLAVGVAVVRALNAAGVSGVALKWPNDILWGKAKLGGILIEVIGESHGNCAVVIGLGLNRHISDTSATGIEQAWTDLGRIASHSCPSRNRLIGLILNELLGLLDSYVVHGLAAYLDEWRSAHAFAGQEATIRIGGTLLEGIIDDVTQDGLLVLKEMDGRLRQFASGDLQLRLKT